MRRVHREELGGVIERIGHGVVFLCIALGLQVADGAEDYHYDGTGNGDTPEEALAGVDGPGVMGGKFWSVHDAF